MPTIESRIAPDGAVTYRAKVRLKGAPQVSASFARKTDAAKWGHATEVAIREDRYFKSPASRQRTFADAVDRYVREVLPRKPRTAKFQARQLAWWRSEIGHLFLADVTAGIISVVRARLLSQSGRTKRARGPATVNRYMAVLSHVSVSPYGNGSGLKPTPHTGSASSRSREGAIASSPRKIVRDC